VLVNGAPGAYVPRGGRQLLVYLPEDEPGRSSVGRAIARRLAAIARGEEGRGGLLVAEINGMPTADHPLSPFLIEAGFTPSAMGFQMRRPPAVSEFVKADGTPAFVSARRAGRGDSLP